MPTTPAVRLPTRGIPAVPPSRNENENDNTRTPIRPTFLLQPRITVCTTKSTLQHPETLGTAFGVPDLPGNSPPPSPVSSPCHPHLLCPQTRDRRRRREVQVNAAHVKLTPPSLKSGGTDRNVDHHHYHPTTHPPSTPNADRPAQSRPRARASLPIMPHARSGLMIISSACRIQALVSPPTIFNVKQARRRLQHGAGHPHPRVHVHGAALLHIGHAVGLLWGVRCVHGA